MTEREASEQSFSESLDQLIAAVRACHQNIDCLILGQEPVGINAIVFLRLNINGLSRPLNGIYHAN